MLVRENCSIADAQKWARYAEHAAAPGRRNLLSFVSYSPRCTDICARIAAALQSATTSKPTQQPKSPSAAWTRRSRRDRALLDDGRPTQAPHPRRGARRHTDPAAERAVAAHILSSGGQRDRAARAPSVARARAPGGVRVGRGARARARRAGGAHAQDMWRGKERRSTAAFT